MNFLEKLKEFSLFEKINLIIIELYFSHEVYLNHTVEIEKWGNDPSEVRWTYILSILIIGFMMGIPAGVLYFHRMGHEMVWIRGKDEPEVNSMVSKLISNTMLLICSVVTLIYYYNKFYS